MQPVGNGQQQPDVHPVFDEKKREKLGLLTDQEIDQLSPQETKERLKKAQVTIISENSSNEKNASDLEIERANSINALAQTTNRQVIANIAENQQNRRDFNVMQRDTTLCTIARVASLVGSIALFIISVILFLL